MLVDDAFDAEECRQAMQAYCREVVLIPNPYVRKGLAKRLLQLRSLALPQSFERLQVMVPALSQPWIESACQTVRHSLNRGVPVPWLL